jgi:dTDP-4-dehydrorhamnose reductase
MRVLILGAGGMLGHDLIDRAPESADVVPVTHREVDITDEGSLAAAIREAAPEIIMNAAAYTAVDAAEADSERAKLVNSIAAGSVAMHAVRTGSLLVHFSTDYVFDGRSNNPYAESAEPRPINVYGSTKLAGERAIQASGARHMIIRTSWLFGVNGRSFPRTMWQRATASQSTRVVNDQVGRPTFTKDLADATWSLASGPGSGVYHVTNSGSATWFDVASHVFQRLDRQALLTPCTSAEYPTPATRPARSLLDSTRSDPLLRTLRPWRDALDDFLNHLVRTHPSS